VYVLVLGLVCRRFLVFTGRLYNAVSKVSVGLPKIFYFSLTSIVQIIEKDAVTCFFATQCIVAMCFYFSM